MNQLKNNKVVLGIFAILMAIGLTAAYIPLIFAPSQNAAPEATAPDENQIATTTTNNYAAQLPKAAVTISTSSMPESFSGLQDEQKSLDELNNLLNK